jgi:hypothetical protein
MGRLTPGARYTYEKIDGVTYALEEGLPETSKFEIGRDYIPGMDLALVFGVPASTVAELATIVKAAESSPALQDALEKLRIVYQLAKQQDQSDPSLFWHSV